MKKANRSKTYFAFVSKSERGQGKGWSLAEDAIRLMSENGAETVDFSPTSERGQGLLGNLICPKGYFRVDQYFRNREQLTRDPSGRIRVEQ